MSALVRSGPPVVPTPSPVSVPVYTMSKELVFAKDGMTDNCMDSRAGMNSDLPMAGSPYTIEAWVMPEEVSPSESFGIVGWGVPRYNQLNGLIFFRGSDSLRNVWWQNDLQANLEKPLADGSYHHVAATWDGSTSRMFVDFVEVASKASSGYGVMKKDNFCVGRAWHQDGSDANFIGKIKDLKIWKHALSASEMRVDTGKQAEANTKQDERVSVSHPKKNPKYRVHTQIGFLNIHSEPGDPFRQDNVVGKWLEGDVVEVINGPVQTEYGPWLQTPRGWSIQVYRSFEWLRPLSVEIEATQEDKGKPKQASIQKANPGVEDEGSEKKDGIPKQDASIQDKESVQSDMDEQFVYEGVLSLQFFTQDVDPQAQLNTHQNALVAGLKSYFGFVSVSLQSASKVDVPSGRRLRSLLAQSTIRFKARGGRIALADDSGIKTAIQEAFNAAGAHITVDSASVEWLVTTSQEPESTGDMWMFAGLGLLFSLVSCGILAFFVFQRMRPATQRKVIFGTAHENVNAVFPKTSSPTLHDAIAVNFVQPGGIKSTKDGDDMSESTVEGDNISEGAPSSATSVAEEVSV